MLRCMKKKASAVWIGDLRTGDGALRSGSGLLEDTPYTWANRFENTPGTTPEELVAAAHAACFTMALVARLNQEGFHVWRITGSCTVALEQREGTWDVTRSDLEVEGRIPGIDAARFTALATETKDTCPISRLLKAPIGLAVTLDERSERPPGMEPDSEAEEEAT